MNKMTANRAAMLIGVLGIVILVFGYIDQHGLTANFVVVDLYANVGIDFIGTAITVLVIDSLNERRQQAELKSQLIRDLGSGSNVFALRSVNELRAHGSRNSNWLSDGTLHNAFLLGADLSKSPLEGASLCGADLTDAKLTQAFLADAKLQNAVLKYCDLSDASLEEADLSNADLCGAILHRTNVQGANLRGTNIHEAILFDIKYNSDTLWPDGFNISLLS